MASQTGVWGIDLGQCALKALRLQEIDGVLTVTAFDYVEHPKILSQPDADPDQLTREALEKFLSRNTLRGDLVSISVPGQSGLARFVKLPPVEEKKIADIVRFEAKQQIPFNLDEVVWDYQRIGAGEVSEGFAMNIEIGLFAMKRDMINRYLQHFKDVGVEVHFVQMAPLALCNYVAYDLLGKGARTPDEEEAAANCIVALDIGADSSNLIITNAGAASSGNGRFLSVATTLPALTKELKLTFAKAEHLKRNAVKSPDLKKILTALKPVLNDFVGEVQRSLGYFTNSHRDADLEYIIGLGNAFRLPGLQRYLGEKLSLEVRKLSKMERLTGDEVLSQAEFSENILSFAVAYGLALQGMNHARLSTNLLPNEIRVERLVRGKKPWAAAAAALLILGTSALAFQSGREAHVFANPQVKAAQDNVKTVLGKVTTANTQLNDAKGAARKEEEAVRSIVAGQPEFKNWIELTKFLSDSLPQPDGRNLPERAKSVYWTEKPTGAHPAKERAMSGMAAFKEWTDRLAGKKPKDDTFRDDLGVGIDDLVQINIQSLDARYTEDLPGFWNAARAVSKENGNVRPPEHAAKAPEGKGWIIEIQGYTFHHKTLNFLRDTLLENMAAKGAPDAGKPTTPVPAPGTPAPGTPGAAPKPATQADLDMPATGPVVNRIGHILLYKFAEKDTNDTYSFEILGRSDLPDLAKANAPAAGRPGSTTVNATSPGAALRETWTPLGLFAVANAGAAARPAPPAPVPAVPGRGGPEKPTGAEPIKHRRTEFVILFVWKEPTPSAALRKEEPDIAAPPPGAAPLPAGVAPPAPTTPG